MNGHTLTQGNSNNRIGTTTNGHLVIKNGNLTSNSTEANVLAMANGGTIELQNVNVTTAQSATAIAIQVNPNKNITSTFRMYGGSIRSSTASSLNVAGEGVPIVEIRNVDITGNGSKGAFRIENTSTDPLAKVEINGYNTKISSANVALNITGSIPCTITGGTIESAQSYPIHVKSTEASSVTIKGGTIKTLEGNTNYAVYVEAMPSKSSFEINSGDFSSYNRVIGSGSNNAGLIKVTNLNGIEEPYFYSYKSDGSSSDYVRLFYKENDGSAPQVRCGYFGCASPAEGWLINVSDFGGKTQKTLDPGKSHNGLTYTKHVE